MDVPQRFCVRWNSYKSNLQTAFPKLLTSEHFVDVTLACEKQYIKCHKIVLSACSLYFETLLVNNPCQHPIIFMKDVEFWEIKALVEFMYKGEVNVSQNQLDSLLKSAESLQIRGLSGTKQFVNFEQSDEDATRVECVGSECKSQRNKSDNEEEEEGSKKRRKRAEEDEKFVQISSVKEEKVAFGENNIEDEIEFDELKQEPMQQDEFEYKNACMDPGEGEEEEEEEEEVEEGDRFIRDVFYTDHGNAMPGPSGISDMCSLALNHVECIMDQDKVVKPGNSSKNTLKCHQQRHQEHNYTNPPPMEETLAKAAKTEATNEPTSSVSGDNQRTMKNSGSKTGNGSQSKSESNSRLAMQPSSTVPPDRQTSDAKSRVVKKDAFNRIRRSEEELQKAAEMVRGGMTFQTASDTFNIPISTIRFYMARRGILPQRRRGRGSSGVRDDDLIHPPFEIIHYRLPDIDKPI